MHRKTYKQLCKEREDIIYLQKTGSHHGSLKYILMCIEKEMIPYEIVYRMKLYQRFSNKIPIELIIHIASYGDCIDDISSKFLEEGKLANIDVIDP